MASDLAGDTLKPSIWFKISYQRRPPAKTKVSSACNIPCPPSGASGIEGPSRRPWSTGWVPVLSPVERPRSTVFLSSPFLPVYATHLSLKYARMTEIRRHLQVFQGFHYPVPGDGVEGVRDIQGNCQRHPASGNHVFRHGPHSPNRVHRRATSAKAIYWLSCHPGTRSDMWASRRVAIILSNLVQNVDWLTVCSRVIMEESSAWVGFRYEESGFVAHTFR